MARLSSHGLHHLAFSLACIVGGALSLCENEFGDGHCASVLAGTNFCQLDRKIRCNCAKDCQARPKCTGKPGDNDQLCDCPIFSFQCGDPAMAWYRTMCPYTCGLYDTVTCQPLMTVTGASPLYNKKPPGDDGNNNTKPPRYMEAVTWQCDPGWQQTSGLSPETQYKRVCIADGSWLLHTNFQSPALTCARKSCGPVPQAPAHATPTVSSGVFEDTVNYTCKLGFSNQVSDQGTHRCNQSAMWERLQPDPDCTVVQCGAPPSVPNATPSVSSGTYDTLISYSCLSGYVRTGPGNGFKRCNATGHWQPAENNADIVCTGRSCGDAPFVIGAVPSSATGIFPGSVNYTCSAGYITVGGGRGQRACTADGSWARNDPADADPLCLGEFTNFVNSESEIQSSTGTAANWTSVSARSNLHCASLCAASVHCHGFNFTTGSGECSMNTGTPLPVISIMKKRYK